MSDEEILAGRVLEDTCLTLAELCAACALEQEWVVRHVEEGLLSVSGMVVSEWRFSSAGLARARRMREIEREFDAVPELAALVADMLEEMDALRARLRKAGLG